MTNSDGDVLKCYRSSSSINPLTGTGRLDDTAFEQAVVLNHKGKRKTPLVFEAWETKSGSGLFT